MDDSSNLNFGDSAGVLRYIQERSDDIERAIIPLFTVGHLPATPSSPAQQIDDVGLIIDLVNGHQHLIHKDDAEVILNDGILNRMRIKIHMWSPSDGSRFEIPE